MAEQPDPYPFPTGVHITSSVTIKLSDSNYLLWKTQMESLLRSQKLLGFATGQILPPPEQVTTVVNNVPVQTPNPRFEEWTCTDQLVISWIYGTLTEEVLGTVHCLTTFHDVWFSLADNYNKSSIAREFELRRSLQLMSKKGKDFATYCREFRAICDKLSSIGKPVEESMKIFSFTNGLGREYDPIITVIQSSMTRVPAPTLNDVISEVSGFDTRLQSYEATSDVLPNMAFQTQRGFYNNYNRGRGNNYSRSRGGFSNRGGYSSRGGFSTRGRGFTQQVSNSGGNNNNNNNNTRPVCQICGRTGHSALRCWNRFDNSYQSDDLPHALSAFPVSDLSGREWIADSGATAHMTSSTSHMQNATPYNGPEHIMVADGNFLPITHVGSTTLTTDTGSLPLNDVLICPSMQKSLLSVSKLCDDYPCGVFFDSNAVYVIDLDAQKVVTKGPRNKGLYVLETRECVAYFSNRQCAASDIVWHQRLGHANFQILQLLKHSKAIIVNKSSTSPVCGPCQMEKSSQLPFFISESSVKELIDRIHCDLWGPSPVVSVQGFKYYAVFVDNFSRYSWIIPLKAKSDFYDVFIVFQKQVENQFNKKLKVFQSDGGGEFTITRFRNHLRDQGIIHLLSCPSTPQQNGIAERKHRHLTELGLSMLFQIHTPLKYWVEAFYSANFISNMIPSSVLSNKSPSEVLFNKTPDYSFLRIFGSACYPCLRPYSQYKFDPRSLQCVFLGYHPQYKGYRFLHPPTGRVYISRHVIFDEQTFPFTGQYKHLLVQHATGLLKAWQDGTAPTAPPVYLPTVTPQVTEYPQTERSVTTGHDMPVTVDESPLQSMADSPDIAPRTPEEPGPSHTAPTTPEETGPSHPMTTRSRAGIIKPNPRYALVASKTIPALPKTIAEALAHPGWRQAMLEELDSIYQNNTWVLTEAT
ncbi:uncharacterized protein LOC106352005 [Brassica napus]|uniref:uncharacterized protein LOC106352005 n=1 Tax=Brassica napus TaxID=3708 RepID=UPI0020789B01|nr:uncharacterized protein LOC106352005 [Brassica napus]